MSGEKRKPVAILTRPGDQNAALAAALARAGVPSLTFPLIAIEPITDAIGLAALDAAIRRACDVALVFFVSPNAVDHVFARAHRLGIDLAAALRQRNAVEDDGDAGWPGGPIVAVIGPGTVRQLARHGVHVATHRLIGPRGAFDARPRGGAAPVTDTAAAHASDVALTDWRFDSETLVQSLDEQVGLARFNGRPVLLFRGDGGREWFADALRGAGSNVTAVTAYHRCLPCPQATAWQALDAMFAAERPAVWVLTSSEGIHNLVALVLARESAAPAGAAAISAAETPETAETPRPGDAARRMHLPASHPITRAAAVVPHHRIEAAARRAGFDRIVAAAAGDDDILRAVLAAAALHRQHRTQHDSKQGQ